MKVTANTLTIEINKFMKNKKTHHLVTLLCAGVLSLGVGSSVNATLVPTLGGLAVYDTVHDISWFADPDFGNCDIDGGLFCKPRQTLDEARTWASTLEIGGATEWRLPSALEPSGAFLGFNSSGGELGRLATQLGTYRIHGTFNGVGCTELSLCSLFDSGISTEFIWTGTSGIVGGRSSQFIFTFGQNRYGAQDIPTTRELRSWAVHDGDVGAIVSGPGSTVDDPLLPDTTTVDPITGLPTFNFIVNAVSNRSVYLDPDIATGYKYTTDSHNFNSILIPKALPNGDDKFLLDLGQAGQFSLLAGQTFDLTSIQAGGFASLSVTGIDTNELLDPHNPLAFVSAFTFGGTGQTAVTMTPITTSVTSPIPLSLILIGFFIMISIRYKNHYSRSVELKSC